MCVSDVNEVTDVLPCQPWCVCVWSRNVNRIANHVLTTYAESQFMKVQVTANVGIYQSSLTLTRTSLELLATMLNALCCHRIRVS